MILFDGFILHDLSHKWDMISINGAAPLLYVLDLDLEYPHTHIKKWIYFIFEDCGSLHPFIYLIN